MVGLMIFLLIILIVLSGFFSGAESAYLSLNKIRLKRLLEKNVPKANLVKELKDDPHELITTILIGNNIVNIMASSIATAVAINLFGSVGVGIATGVITLAVLIFGEITPKTYALANREKICLFAARPLKILKVVFWPIIKVLDLFTKTISKIFPSPQMQTKVTEDEIKSIVNIGEEEGSIDKHEKEMIYNIFKFNDLEVSEIMIPRTDVISISYEKSVKEALKIFLKTGLSRIPVYNSDMDNIVGIVHIKDALKAVQSKRSSKKVKSIMKKAYFVPEQKRIVDLLTEFQRKKIHMAVVVDEYKGVEGIITIEDILEEIVGDIYDETDKEETLITKKSKHEALVSGKAEIEDINKELDLKLKPEDDSVETIAGLILEKIERIPKTGEEIKLKKVCFTVTDADAKGINEVKVVVNNK